MLVVMGWVYAAAMVAPTISKTLGSSQFLNFSLGLPGYGTFGYNKHRGKCDYMDDNDDKDDNDDNGPRALFMSLGFGLPFILIVASYFGIWRTSILSGAILKPSGYVKFNLASTLLSI